MCALETLGSSEVVWLTRVRPGGRWVCPTGSSVNPGLLGSLGCTMGVFGFIRGRWVHPESQGSLWL